MRGTHLGRRNSHKKAPLLEYGMTCSDFGKIILTPNWRPAWKQERLQTGWTMNAERPGSCEQVWRGHEKKRRYEGSVTAEGWADG